MNEYILQSKMKHFERILICFLLVLFTQQSFAQKHSFIPDSLRVLTQEEMANQMLQLDGSMDVYNPEGQILDQMETMQALGSGEYTIDALYGNQDGKLRALVLRQASDEEKASMRRAMEEEKAAAEEWLGRQAPDFSGKDLEGEEFTLESLKGNIVVLNFWFTTCKPCIQEMPELNELVSNYEGKNVRFISVTFNKKEHVEAFLEQTPFKYEIVPDAEDITKIYHVEGFPSHFVIDENGYVRFQLTGFIPGIGDLIDLKIKELL